MNNKIPTKLMFMREVKQAILDEYNTTRQPDKHITMEQCDEAEEEIEYEEHAPDQSELHAENLKIWLHENKIIHIVHIFHSDEAGRAEDDKMDSAGRYGKPPLMTVMKLGTTTTRVFQVLQRPTNDVEGYIIIEEEPLCLPEHDFSNEAKQG